MSMVLSNPATDYRLPERIREVFHGSRKPLAVSSRRLWKRDRGRHRLTRIGDLAIDERLHFLGVEPCVGECLLLRHVAELEEPEQVAAADLLTPLDEFLSDGLRAANDGEAAVLDVLPGFAAVDEGLAV